MLSGAVAGLVFASPPTRTISAAIRALAKQNESKVVAHEQFFSVSLTHCFFY